MLLCGVGAAGFGWLWSSAALSTAGEVDFSNRLAVPPLAPSRVDGEGRRVFNLRAGEGRHDFGNGPVKTWGFNGDYLGPTLRAKRGEQVVVNVRNGLAEDTTVHWHGMHLPAKMDGGPHQMVRPGETWSPRWRVDQPASTLWYHPHPHGQTAEHVYRGLAGMFIVDDPKTSSADLPSQYGVDDIPVLVQDKQFDGERLDESTSQTSGVGILGDTIAVNGTVAPYLDVTTEQVRLRLLNGSTARVYDFGFADERPFALVGTDGGLLPAPQHTKRVALSPGERAEIVVTMRAGERAVLRSFPPPLGLDPLSSRFTGGDDTLDVLQLRAAKRLADRPEVPERLVDVPRLDPAEAAQRRDFRLSGHNINREKMDMSRIDTTVEKGAVEVWSVFNNDGQPHSFHVHDVQFQVVSRDGGAPPPHLSGWKDTLYLPPSVRFEIIMRFADYADPDAPYMYHCHVLFHEDAGMMGQFVVVEPGQKPGNPAGGHGGHG
ncbi:MAG: multicopper oxidase domain-containing protein [Micromonosporaceae bacterium]|nr:multicopper oxidase domain-containing protein [Micromonosporaceae bacterium]